MKSELHDRTMASELGVAIKQVTATVELLDDGATVPFLACYRKEVTGGLDEVVITSIRDRVAQLRELDKRRSAILTSLEEQGNLTDGLEKQVQAATSMTELEDLYLPYRPKRRTRAMIAKERGLEPLALSLSHETIYRFIYSDPTRKAELQPFLRQGRRHRRKRYGSGARASGIPNRISITERPHEVEQKERLGDWECDTVIGQDRKSVLVTVVDRVSLYTVCSRGLSRSAHVVSQAIIRLLRPFKERVKTLMFDNGSEFVKHERIARALEATTYFVHPYSSWERGINEHTNGLLRQFFPKHTDFRKISWQQVTKAVDLLNNRPRKTRGYRTPNQLFNHHFVPLI